VSDKELKFRSLLLEAINLRVFPGCAVVLIDGDDIFRASFGNFTYDAESPKVTTKTIYDVASLTKIVAPMALAMMLVDEGVLDLTEKVGTYLPEFVNHPEKADVLLAHVVTYTLDYDIPGGSKSLMGQLSPAQIVLKTLQLPLKAAPGTQYMYSNITPFILTQIIERVTGKRFEQLVTERVLDPLNMETAAFVPPKELLESIPPTEITADRGEVRGFVHDEFTYQTTLGGISNGAAGLFASIHDMQKFLQMTLSKGGSLFSKEMVSLWTQDYYPELLPVHTPIGWGDLNNLLIDKFHREIVVKSGFTGCFMAADLKYKKGFVILSNRIYPTRPKDATAFSTLKEKLMAIALS